MTDESKPKVEPWMREACVSYRVSRDRPHEDEVQANCICEIIASAFARSRPAVAAGDLFWVVEIGRVEHHPTRQVRYWNGREIEYDVKWALRFADKASAERLAALALEKDTWHVEQHGWLGIAPPSSDPAPAHVCTYECAGNECETAGAVAPVEGTLLMLGQVARERDSLRTRFDASAALIERLKKALSALLHCDYKKCPDVDCIDSRKKARAAIKEAEGRKG